MAKKEEQTRPGIKKDNSIDPDMIQEQTNVHKNHYSGINSRNYGINKEHRDMQNERSHLQTDGWAEKRQKNKNKEKSR